MRAIDQIAELETEINKRCRQAIARRRQDPDWRVWRGWDLYDPEASRLSGLSFQNRVRLVLDQQEGRRSPFAVTMAHYSVRKQIAHGRLQSVRIDVSAFVKDRYVIQTAPHRAG